MAATTDIRALEEDPRLYLYTSLTAGSSHIITATSRIQVILTANRYPFIAVDLATNEPAKRLFQRRGGKRKLPVLAKEGFILGDLNEIEEWNEFGELADNLGPPVPIDQTAAVSEPAATPGATSSSAEKDTSSASKAKEEDKPVQQLAALAAEAAAVAKNTANKAADKITEALPSNDYVAAKKATESDAELAKAGATNEDGATTTVAETTDSSSKSVTEKLPVRQAEAKSEPTPVASTTSTSAEEPTADVDPETVKAAEQEMSALAGAATSTSAPAPVPSSTGNTDSATEAGTSLTETISQEDIAEIERENTIPEDVEAEAAEDDEQGKGHDQLDETGKDDKEVTPTQATAPKTSDASELVDNEKTGTAAHITSDPGISGALDQSEKLQTLTEKAKSTLETETAESATKPASTISTDGKAVLEEAKEVTQSAAASTTSTLKDALATGTAAAAAAVAAIAPSTASQPATSTEAVDQTHSSPDKTSADDVAKESESEVKPATHMEENVKPTPQQSATDGGLATSSVVD